MHSDRFLRDQHFYGISYIFIRFSDIFTGLAPFYGISNIFQGLMTFFQGIIDIFMGLATLLCIFTGLATHSKKQNI